MLEDVMLVGVDSNRTKAYLQLLEKNNVMPSYVLLLSPDNHSFANSAGKDEAQPYFDPYESVLHTLQKNEVKYETIRSSDINDPIVSGKLQNARQHYVIYSGYGGQILKSHLFRMNKRFIHIHPGIVPEFRGSTTMYYSLLSNGTLGATALFLDESIDTGPIIQTKEYAIPPNNVDLDYIFDPFMRADLLAEVLVKYRNTGYFSQLAQDTENGETYRIIHPVLKHIAILSELEKNRM
jgi:methionyl-tRNA formyltransferase